MLRIAEPELVRSAERGELGGRRIGDEWRFGRQALLAWLSGTTVASRWPRSPDPHGEFTNSSLGS